MSNFIRGLDESNSASFSGDDYHVFKNRDRREIIFGWNDYTGAKNLSVRFLDPNKPDTNHWGWNEEAPSVILSKADIDISKDFFGIHGKAMSCLLRATIVSGEDLIQLDALNRRRYVKNPDHLSLTKAEIVQYGYDDTRVSVTYDALRFGDVASVSEKRWFDDIQGNCLTVKAVRVPNEIFVFVEEHGDEYDGERFSAIGRSSSNPNNGVFITSVGHTLETGHALKVADYFGYAIGTFDIQTRRIESMSIYKKDQWSPDVSLMEFNPIKMIEDGKPNGSILMVHNYINNSPKEIGDLLCNPEKMLDILERMDDESASEHVALGKSNAFRLFRSSESSIL